MDQVMTGTYFLRYDILQLGNLTLIITTKDEKDLTFFKG
jgi:hypothetical protein